MQLALAITGHPLNVEFKMGTQVSVDVIRDWLRSAPYRPLWGQFTVKVIDEVNTVPATAITELRQFLDFLQPWTVVIATTNLPPNKLPEPLQTRFTVYHFDRIPSKLVAAHLIEKFPEVPPEQLAEIATKTAGDVRAAKADAAQQRNVLRFIQECSSRKSPDEAKPMIADELFYISECTTKMGDVPSVSLIPVLDCPPGVPCKDLCYDRIAWRLGMWLRLSHIFSRRYPSV